MEIKYLSLHIVDHNEKASKEIPVTDHSESLKSFVTKIIEELLESNNKQEFISNSDTTEVMTVVNQYLDEKYDAGSKILADRLALQEFKTQAKYAIAKILKGTLLQAHVIYNNQSVVLVCKIDHTEFIDEKDFLKKIGLPIKNTIYKAFMVKYNEEKTERTLFVYDTNSTMAKYWWESFLELTQKYTNEYNTQTVLDLLDKKLFTPIKKKYPSDYTILRNSSIGYFRNNHDFILDEFIDKTLSNYIPVNNEINTDSMIEQLRRLQEKHNFDCRFTIEKSAIKKKAIRKVDLENHLELVLKDSIPHLNKIIKSFKDEEGKKYIVIRTNKGYDAFESNEDNQ